MVSIIITGNDPTSTPSFQPIEQPVCGVCQTQFSRYTCPHCNLHYCNLVCFRSNKHINCSENFDRINLLEEINSSKDKTNEEKKGMLELLKRFEEEAAAADASGVEGEAGDENDEEEGEIDEERKLLEEKLEGIDLDTLTPEELLDLLSPTQREQFDTTLRDPVKASKLVDEEFEAEIPWWELSSINEVKEDRINELDEEEEEEEEEERPSLIDTSLLPSLKIGEDGKAAVNPLLVYNVVAVLFAYSYTLRTFSLTSFSSLSTGSTERNTAIQVFNQLLPFLFEKSTLVFDDVGSSIEYVISRETPGTLSSDLLALLLKDVSALLQPASITIISPNPTTSTTSQLLAHPLSQPLTALSDLHNLFSSSAPLPSKSIVKRPPSLNTLPLPPTLNGAKQKIIFYIAFLSDSKSPLTVDGVREIAERVGREGEKREEEEKESKIRIKNMKLKMEEGKRKLEEEGKKKKFVTEIVGPRIQEIE